MDKYAGVKVFLFFLVLLIFIFGGFILMKQSVFKEADNNIVELKPDENKKDIRIDNSKDYIYYTDAEHITHELDIEYKNIHLNFKDSDNIASKLNNETKDLKATLLYDETNENTVYDNLVSAKYKIYNNYTYDNYISLVIDYYEYHYESLVSYLNTVTYVFDKNSGNLITADELLGEYHLTKEDVINKIKMHIEAENIAKEGEELDVQGTIDNINELHLFIDKIGRLSVSILVKSDQKDYNEIIILN